MRPVVLFVWLSLASLHAQSTESLEFTGPENAPIYVIAGQVSGSHSYRELLISYDWESETDPASGLLSGSGNFSAEGGDIDLDGSLSVKMSIKSAGSAVRIGGKINVQATGIFNGYTIDRCILNYAIPGMSINPSAGTAGGYVSATGSLRATTGKKAAARVAKTFLSLDLPDTNGSGWDSGGDWATNINATVDRKGKISGTGEMAVLDKGGQPYDLISQKISGTVKNGIVTMAAAGSSRATSKIKVSLTYRQDNQAALTGRSSVSAYGQSRKF